MHIRRPLPVGQRSLIRLLQYGMTVSEAASEYGIPRGTIATWHMRNKFKSTEACVIGRELYILPSAIERMLKEKE